MVTPQDLLCKLSLFNMQLVKYQLNCWVIDLSLKNIAKDKLLCPFSPTAVCPSSSDSPPFCVRACTDTHATGDRSFPFVPVFHNSPDYYSVSSLLILFYSPSTSYSASHLNLIWMDHPSVFSVMITHESTPPNISFCLLSKQKYWPVSLTFLCEFVTSRTS